MDFYKKSIELNMDGIVFYPIGSDPYNINCNIHHDYYNEQLESIKGFPRSCWAFFKLSGVNRNFYDENGSLMRPLNKNNDLIYKAMAIVNTINEINKVSVKQRQSTNDMLFDYVKDELQKL